MFLNFEYMPYNHRISILKMTPKPSHFINEDTESWRSKLLCWLSLIRIFIHSLNLYWVPLCQVLLGVLRLQKSLLSRTDTRLTFPDSEHRALFICSHTSLTKRANLHNLWNASMCDKNACGFCWGFFPPGFAYHGRFLEINHIIHTKKKASRSLCYMLFDEQLTYFINVAYLGYKGII